MSWIYDYGKGFKTPVGKANQLKTGKVWRKRRLQVHCKILQLHHIQESQHNRFKNYLPENGAWEKENGISYAAYRNISDFEPVNILMRKVKSKTIIDIAFVSGSLFAIIFIFYNSAKRKAIEYKEKTD